MKNFENLTKIICNNAKQIRRIRQGKRAKQTDRLGLLAEGGAQKEKSGREQ